MPFQSEKQRRYLWKNHPKIARDWTDTYGSKPVKKQSGGTMTTEETFKKMVPFSPWTSPKFKWKRWLLAPYKNAQEVDKMVKTVRKNPKNFVTRLKKKIAEVEGLSQKEALRVLTNKPVKKKDGGLPKLDKYYGSYIKGTVDGHKLSNPTYRKYYKGLI